MMVARAMMNGAPLATKTARGRRKRRRRVQKTERVRVWLDAPPHDTWVQFVCKRGQGKACCRYLAMVGGGWSCEKRSPLRDVIDRRVAHGQMVAKGDNCDGKKSRT
jgi:hypothetical protein